MTATASYAHIVHVLDTGRVHATVKYRLPLISVAVVDGAAIGGGAELSTCCDFRVAGPESVVRFVQVKVRIFPSPRFPHPRPPLVISARSCKAAIVIYRTPGSWRGMSSEV